MSSRVFFLFFCISWTCLFKAQIAIQSFEQIASVKYEQLLFKFSEQNNPPGAILGIKKKGQSSWIGAVGFSSRNEDLMGINTQFRCGSITKLFMAVLVLQLVEVGEIQLDEPIVLFLPQLKGQIPNIEKATVRQLLNHSVGLRHPTEDNFLYRLEIGLFPSRMERISFQQRLEKYVYRKPLMFTPGESVYYSNAGYWLIGLLLEQVTGSKLEELLQNKICKPLALNDTFIERKTTGQIAKGYHRVGKRFFDVSKYDQADSQNDPAAGLISTASDLLIFMEALFSEKLITNTFLNEMLAFKSYNGVTSEYALGIESWDFGTTKGFGKNGSSLGLDANLIYIPDLELSIVIFSNNGAGNDKSILNEILDF